MVIDMDDLNRDTYRIDEGSTLDMVRMFNNEDKKVSLAVERCLDSVAQAIDLLYESVSKGGRIVYIGSGTGGKLGVLDATECPPTFGVEDGVFIGLISGGREALEGWREDTEDDEALAIVDLQNITFSSKDVLVGISASGNTPYVLAALDHAKKIGSKTIAICCSPKGRVASLTDICITLDVGPEAIMGSTRLKGGTAQKLVLNMLSSCTMIKLGKTYYNLMVDVRPINAKLRHRIETMISFVTGKEKHLITQALEACGWHCKTAILMLELDLDADTAQKLLSDHQGYLKQVFQSVGITSQSNDSKA
jgi:N-acetylmuramic acid 6-phosphate etherase